MRRSRLWLAAGFLAVMLGMHVWGVVALADREPHMDETEYLHAGWLMANGGRLYETFFEHHSPLFFKVLEWLAPEGSGVDVRPYFVHARWLTGFCGLVALVMVAAVLWRAAPEAGGIAIGLLLASSTLWLRAFAELRAEAYALAFYWVGAWLVLRFRGVWGGVGIGLAAISCLWQPKWPIACFVLGVLWLIRTERRVLPFAAALVTAGAGFAAIRAIVPFDVWWFFNFDVNKALTDDVATSKWVHDSYFKGGEPFLYVLDIFHPWLMVPAGVVVGAAAWADRTDWTDRTLDRLFPLILLAASFVELRWVYPWPGIWAHYYVMWSIAAAMILALVPSSLEILLRRIRVTERVVGFATTAILLTSMGVILAHVWALRPAAGDRTTYWISQKFLRERLGPNDIVWLEPPRHPVSVRDAHYYWFSVGQMVGAAMKMRQTERGRHYLPRTDDLPTCTVPANMRYTLDPIRAGLTEAGACMQRLIDGGQVRKTVFFDVWEVRLKSPAKPPA